MSVLLWEEHNCVDSRQLPQLSLVPVRNAGDCSGEDCRCPTGQWGLLGSSFLPFPFKEKFTCSQMIPAGGQVMEIWCFLLLSIWLS